MLTATLNLLSIATILAASKTYALPQRSPSDPAGLSPRCQCLTPESAQYLVSGYSSLLTAYTTANANQYLSDSFTDTSDSINFLIGAPLGSVTFPSKAAFEAGQGAQPPIDFQVLNIDAVTCDTIVFRWIAQVGTQPVKGINIMVASNANGTDESWQIETNYSEFNSAVWVLDIGGTCQTPKTSQ
jgi:hypothetical protein